MPILRRAGAWDDSASQDALDQMEAEALEWAVLLEVAFEHEGGAKVVEARLGSWIDVEGLQRDMEGPVAVSVTVEELQSERLTKVATEDLRVPFAISNRFTDRILEWFRRLLSDGVADVVRTKAPPPAVFTALPIRRNTSDEVGQWIWDRFTKTRLEEWSEASLIREWHLIQTDESAIPTTVLRERICEPSQVAAIALQRLTTRVTEGSATQPPQLSAEDFVMAANQHLRAGRYLEAANIFEGLVELHPTDGDALNNLGFCLMPQDPSRALSVLQRASLYPMQQRTINAANRVLALQLTDRRDAAQILAKEFLSGADSRTASEICFTWRQDPVTRDLALADEPQQSRPYLEELLLLLEG